MAPAGPIATAARNTALWCDTICRAHDSPGVFDALLWHVPLGPLPLYPDVVTLAGVDVAKAQRVSIDELLAGNRIGGPQVGGAALHRGTGVAGVSNVFARARWHEPVWRDRPALAARLFAGDTLVGYKSGTSFDHAIAAGFVPLHRLRIRHRPV